MAIQITRNTSIDVFTLSLIMGLTLAGIGLYLLLAGANDVQNEAMNDIDNMGCGELKGFIADKGWYDYSMRTSLIKDHAMHTYTWTCEK